MRLILTASAVLFLGAAGVSAAADSNTPKQYTLTVTSDEVNEIGAALGNEPFNKVSALMEKLKAQVTEQTLKASAAALPKSDPDKAAGAPAAVPAKPDETAPVK
jgi:hypothetical protein